MKDYLTHYVIGNKVAFFDLWSELDKYYKVDGMESMKQLARFSNFLSFVNNCRDIIEQSGIYFRLKKTTHVINDMSDFKMRLIEILRTKHDRKDGALRLWKRMQNENSNTEFFEGKDWRKTFKECDDIAQLSKESIIMLKYPASDTFYENAMSNKNNNATGGGTDESKLFLILWKQAPYKLIKYLFF